jgi:uncharacterized NAD-dependent epimerase/dehydratase family protein
VYAHCETEQHWQIQDMNTCADTPAVADAKLFIGKSAVGARPRISDYHRIVLLTDGYSTPFKAKTAMSVLRYREGDILAVFDASNVGRTAGSLFGVGGDTPVIYSLTGVDADALFVGISLHGGSLPPGFRPTIIDALRKGMDVVSGLHDFLAEDPELRALADANGAQLIDVRKNNEKQIASNEPLPGNCLRIHTVGQDCSLGKMAVSLEVQRGLCDRGVDAGFVATGQTGIMIAGDGVPIDCVVSDFVNGAAEALVRRHSDHEVLVVEGQGSISHPSYSGVTTGLLHGCAPHGLIFCYELGRTHVKGWDKVPLLPIGRLIEAYERTAGLRHPCRVIGIGVNTRNATVEEAEEEIRRAEEEFGLPVCDVYRGGAGKLVAAVQELQEGLREGLGL